MSPTDDDPSRRSFLAALIAAVGLGPTITKGSVPSPAVNPADYAHGENFTDSIMWEMGRAATGATMCYVFHRQEF